jgi:hypothetical protein
LGDGKG